MGMSGRLPLDLIHNILSNFIIGLHIGFEFSNDKKAERYPPS
jgi:hypothetical protein